jgi:hypothetical protein|eukprot:COSAG06_NODE_11437_length_1510_cov_3.241144_1_plen_122_part_00
MYGKDLSVQSIKILKGSARLQQLQQSPDSSVRSALGVCGGIAVDEVVAAREKQLEPNDQVLRQAREMQRVINEDLELAGQQAGQQATGDQLSSVQASAARGGGSRYRACFCAVTPQASSSR